VTPLIAAAAMSGSSVLVTLNALRARTKNNAQSPDTIEQTLPAVPAARPT
jgi:Cu2+-exporting ATPase